MAPKNVGINSTFEQQRQVINQIAVDVDNLSNAGFLTSANLVGYATETYVTNSLVGYATEGYVNNSIVGFITSGALTGYATEGYVNNSIVGFITSGALTGYATETYVINSLVGYATEGYVNSSLVGYATEGYVNTSLVGYATEGYVNNAVVGFITSGALIGYATETYVINSLVGYATEGYVNSSLVGFITSGALVGYATETYVTNSLVGYATEGYVNSSLVGFITSGALAGYATEGYVNNSIVGFITSGASGSNLTGIVTYITAGSGIAINQSTGNVTITATGGGGGGIALTDLSVTVSSPGISTLTYNNTTGEFNYTPPNLTGYATTESIVGFITSGASGSNLTGIVTYITAGVGISITQSTGNVTIAATGGGGGTQTLDQTLGYGNTSSLGMSVGISTFNNVVVGGATTALIVNGDVRITGILTLGTAAIELVAQDSHLKIGTGVSIYETGNAIYSGIVTASGFVGNVTGTATSSTAATNAYGLLGTPNISVGNITGAAATFTGNVSIAGTLTYEDVTNVDSIGLVTARAGAHVATSSGSLLVGSSTETGTASQPLQVTGGAYFSGNIGIGTTNPTSKLSVTGDANFTGVVTATSFSGDGSSLSGISAAKGGGTDKIFFENDQTVTADYTITTNKNAMTAGPVAISTGITVTIPSGSTWTIV